MLPQKLASVRRDLCANDILRQIPSAQNSEAVASSDDSLKPGLLAAASELFFRQGHGAGTEARDAGTEVVAGQTKRGAGGTDEEGEGRGARAIVAGVLDLSFVSAYLPSIGFQVAIDGVNNLVELTAKQKAGSEFVWPVAVAGVCGVCACVCADLSLSLARARARALSFSVLGPSAFGHLLFHSTVAPSLYIHISRHV